MGGGQDYDRSDEREYREAQRRREEEQREWQTAKENVEFLNRQIDALIDMAHAAPNNVRSRAEIRKRAEEIASGPYSEQYVND